MDGCVSIARYRSVNLRNANAICVCMELDRKNVFFLLVCHVYRFADLNNNKKRDETEEEKLKFF